MKIYSNSSSTISVWANRSSYLVEYLTMILIAIGVVGITASSHNIGLPLYKLNPMHWVIYFAILLRKPSISSILILAFALPFTSLILTGHPLVFKGLIMSIELSIYGIIFSLIINRSPQFILGAFILSQIVGHVVYFLLKYSFIQMELMNNKVFSSSIIIQIIVIIILGLSVHIISYRRNMN